VREITQEQSKCVTIVATYIDEALTFPTPTHEYFIVAPQKQDLWMQKIIYGTVDV
jgi:hypothetical protein